MESIIEQFGRWACSLLAALHHPVGSATDTADCLLELNELVAQLHGEDRYAAHAVLTALHRERAAVLYPRGAQPAEGAIGHAVQQASLALRWCHQAPGRADITDYLHAAHATERAKVAAAELPPGARRIVRALIYHAEAAIEADLRLVAGKDVRRVAA